MTVEPFRLLDAEFWLAIPRLHRGPGEYTAGESERVSIRAIDEGGVRYMPVFTSEAALLRSLPEGSPFVSMIGSAALTMFLETKEFDALVVDHRSDNAYVLARLDVEQLIAQRNN
jgi:SseB protein N-terminal domain